MIDVMDEYKKFKVSIIIPTYNRPDYLYKSLPSFMIQSNIYEIIVVDDGSTMDYTEVIKWSSRKAKEQKIIFTYIKHNRRKGAPVARNTGVKASSGNLLLFADDDIILDKDFVIKAIRKIEKQDVDIVGGRIIPILDCNKSINDVGSISDEKVFNWLTLQGRYHVDTKQDIELPFISSVGVWKRWIFDNGVRFDEAYGGNGYREETSAQIEASKMGAIILFSPELVAWHLKKDKKKGGQWRGPISWWYIWAVRNNFRFLRKNYSYLKARWNLPYPWWVSFFVFAIKNMSVLLPPKIMRTVKQFWGKRICV